MDEQLERLGDYWKKFSEKLPLPDLEEILAREVTPGDVDYLLKQFATLTIWNDDDVTPAGDGKLMTLPDASSRYKVYDFGCALVATPADLYDPHRTLSDAIQTTKAMVHEVVDRREWNISLAGFGVMVKTAWMKVEGMNRSQKKEVKVHGYQPTADDYEALERQIRIKGP
jgi:hypothetical protein